MVALDLDRHVQETVRWHFDPATGSPFWLRKAGELGFDPIATVQSFADLARFPPVAEEWRKIPATDLIPRGCREEFAVWETGGTTGQPTRIVDGGERTRGIQRVNQILGHHGFPAADGFLASSGFPAADGFLASSGFPAANGFPAVAGSSTPAEGFPAHGSQRPGWLHLGPTGPHLVGTNVARLAGLRGALFHTIDLDPRWVKRLYREGRADEARRYTSHLVDQAVAVLSTQPVTILSTTPPLLQALCERPESYDLLRQQVKGIIWFGTSFTAEGLRLVEEELLPDARLVGWYGNTLMGIACQRPRRPADPYGCIFSPPAPGAILQVIDPAEPSRRVALGETGQVRLSLLNRELFLPWHLERDQAVRIASESPTLWDDVAAVAPLEGGGAQIEGVY